MLKIQILGSFNVSKGERSATPTAPKPRQLLALLAINSGRSVQVPTIIEELWGECPPSSASSVLQNYIMQIRKLFKENLGYSGESVRDVLATRFGGYMLDVPPDALDTHRFADTLEKGRTALRESNSPRAAMLLRNSLSCWTGPALADVQRGSLLELECQSLEESRLYAIQLRIKADLHTGRHRELVGELRTLTARHPYDETLHAQFMLTLYRSGRRMHALDVYRNLRTRFYDEFGLEPSIPIRQLHQGILTADQQLDLDAALLQ
jgi:SARP family transcriptional regulator, regulator of embCAB operon